MAYSPPAIGTNGASIPAYSDIIADLVSSAQGIWGADVYLSPDSPDYQLLSIVAKKLDETNQFFQAVYNNRAPNGAIGAALDSLVKLNGIARLPATYSTATVTLAGTPGTVITTGVVQDASGFQWALPSSVTIGVGGTVDCTATCQTAGPVAALAGTITTIVTLTAGWTSVTNAAAATMGTAAETDSALRARQAVSTALASRTVLEGTEGAIAAVSGVTRSLVLENDTAAADSYGNPAHSITCVAEGGTDNDVATAIWAHKGPGCLANGTTSVNITDSWGQVTPIGFYRPSYVDFDVAITVKGLAGYTSATTDAIKAALAAYLSSLALGTADVYISSLWGAALSAQTLTSPLFSLMALTACVHGGAPGTSDIALTFSQAARGNTAFITVTVV